MNGGKREVRAEKEVAMATPNSPSPHGDAQGRNGPGVPAGATARKQMGSVETLPQSSAGSAELLKLSFLAFNLPHLLGPFSISFYSGTEPIIPVHLLGEFYSFTHKSN